MNRYHRFHRDTSRFHTLFFVALFVLGTVVLGWMFVFGNGSSTASPQEAMIVPAIDSEEYRATVRTALDTFLGEAARAVGVSVDDPTWEERVRAPGVLAGIDRAASRLRETLLKTRVPASARVRHLLLVVTTEELLEGLRSDRVDVVEGLLLKLEEFRSGIQ